MDNCARETDCPMRYYTDIEFGGRLVEDDVGQDFASEPLAHAGAMATILDIALDLACHAGTKMITARVFDSGRRPVYCATLTLGGGPIG